MSRKTRNHFKTAFATGRRKRAKRKFFRWSPVIALGITVLTATATAYFGSKHLQQFESGADRGLAELRRENADLLSDKLINIKETKVCDMRAKLSLEQIKTISELTQALDQKLKFQIEKAVEKLPVEDRASLDAMNLILIGEMKYGGVDKKRFAKDYIAIKNEVMKNLNLEGFTFSMFGLSGAIQASGGFANKEGTVFYEFKIPSSNLGVANFIPADSVKVRIERQVHSTISEDIVQVVELGDRVTIDDGAPELFVGHAITLNERLQARNLGLPFLLGACN